MSETVIILIIAVIACGGVASWIGYEMYTLYPKYMSRGRLILGFVLVTVLTMFGSMLAYGVFTQ